MRLVAPLAVCALAGCNLVFGLDAPAGGDGGADGAAVDGPGSDGVDPLDASDGPPGGPGITAVAAGGAHTCVIRNDRVHCWGLGAFGQLGYGSSVNVGDDEPALGPAVSIGGGLPIQLALGNNFSCVLYDTGDVKCWGENSRGQLGRANTTWIGDDELPSSVQAIAVGATAVQVAAGGQHVCATLASSKVRCWGAGSDGQLGYANQADVGDTETPFAAGDVLAVTGAFAMAAGDAHSCALLNNGAVRCWGYGGDGRLGNGDPMSIGDDEAATHDVDLGVAAVQVVAGNAHTCARVVGGGVRCWGAGADGRLGYGNIDSIGDDEAPRLAGDVSLGREAVGLAAGAAHTCALLADGAVRCWGKNDRGQLGRGNTLSIGDDEPPSIGTPVALGGLAVAIAAGGDHTCALMVDQTVRCWGANEAGQLGLGNTLDLGDDEQPGGAAPVGP